MGRRPSGYRQTRCASGLRRPALSGRCHRLCRAAAKQDAKIILFTDQWLSPIAQFARHVFPVRIETGTTWDSSAASMVMLETLLEGVGQHNLEQVRARIKHLEMLRRPPQS